MTVIEEREDVAEASSLAKSLRALERVLCCLRMYQRPLGLRGMLAYCSYRLFGRPERLAVVPPGIKSQVTLRMRTTDVSIYEDVLFRGHYALPLPFVPETIVDLGANIGMASIYYASQYPNARIVAVEAEASNFEVLLKNVKDYHKIVPIHAAVWNKDGTVALSAPTGSDTAINKFIFTVSQDPGAAVRAITMESLMKEAGVSSIDLLKVDIEGSEMEVFETAPDWIDRVRCLAIELHDRFKPGCRQAVSAVTGDFLESQRGETTFFIRKSCVATAGS